MTGPLGFAKTELFNWLITRPKQIFGFRELVCFKVIRDLTDKGITPSRMRNYLGQLKEILPESQRPLTELKFTIEGGKLLVRKDGQTFDPRGQLHMDLSVKKPRAVASINRWKHAILRTSEYRGKNDSERAIFEYRHLLELEPENAHATVNLGNIYYGIGDTRKARHWYLEALMVDPEHVEGNYNFVNLLDEQGEVETAIVFYLKSIRNEAPFADAHFNVAPVSINWGNLMRPRDILHLTRDLTPPMNGLKLR